MKNPMEMTLGEVQAYMELHGDHRCYWLHSLIEEIQRLQTLDKLFVKIVDQKKVETREKPVTASFQKKQEDFDNVPCEVKSEWDF